MKQVSGITKLEENVRDSRGQHVGTEYLEEMWGIGKDNKKLQKAEEEKGRKT